MSVLLAEIAEGGVRLRAVRIMLAGERAFWTPPGDTPLDEHPALAAAWISAQLRSHGVSSIRSLCVDADSTRFHWLTSPSGDPRILRGAVAQSRPSAWGDWHAPEGEDQGASPTDASTATLEALAPADGLPLARDAAVIVPDVVARVLVDELDRLGLPVERIATLWHQLALAWDPGARPALRDATHDDEPVATDTPTTAVMLIESPPDRPRRVLWCWSSRGQVIAGGSAKPGPGPISDSLDLLAGRLSADWLAWGAQLGAGPRRVALLIDDRLDGVDRTALAQMTQRLCPVATVDAVALEDPIAQTLARMAEVSRPIGTNAREGLVALSHRPGALHRATYRWLAASLAAVAMALGLFGFRLHAEAANLKDSGNSASQEWNAELAQQMPELAKDPFPQLKLNDEISQLRKRLDTLVRGRQDTRPILDELDTIAFVLVSEPGVVLLEATLRSDLAAHIVALVPDLATGEILPEVLTGASKFARYTGRFRERGRGRANLYRELTDHEQIEITGEWLDRAATRDGSVGGAVGGGGA